MKAMHKKPMLPAFSLIELLVVVSIIGVLSTIMLVNLTSSRHQKEVEGAAIQVSAKIREAQTAALTGLQYTADTTPCSYRVTWGGSQLTNSYISKDGSGNCTVVTTMDSLSLSTGVAFTGSGSADFTLPHGQIAASQVLTLQKNSSSQVVCLRSNGLIEPQAVASSC